VRLLIPRGLPILGKERAKMYAETEERILVPLDGPQRPARAFVCMEGATQTARIQQPVLLGPSIPEEYMDRPLRKYLEDKAKELKTMGIMASPVFADSSHANSPLDFAETGDAALFVISIHGPYQVRRRIKRVSSVEHSQLAFDRYMYPSADNVRASV
jgi:hypothetical protein